MVQRLASYITWRRAAVAAAVLAVLAGFVLLGQVMQTTINVTTLRVALNELGVWGPVALVAALASVLVIPAVPASVFQIGAGLAFGPVPGLVYVLLADVLGASAGFALARFWGRSVLERQLSSDSRQKITQLAERLSWRGVFLLRLLPGPVYPFVSFAAGYSPMGFARFISASLSGVFPGLVLLVVAGDMAESSPLLALILVLLLVGGLAIAGKLLNAPQENGKE